MAFTELVKNFTNTDRKKTLLKRTGRQRLPGDGARDVAGGAIVPVSRYDATMPPRAPKVNDRNKVLTGARALLLAPATATD